MYLIFLFFNSLVSSPLGHENVGVAYANRSVVYMKLGFFKTALENIQLARDNGYPQSKLEKLAEREQRCLNKIRTEKSKEDIYQKHENAKKKILGERLPANEKFPLYIADCTWINRMIMAITSEQRRTLKVEPLSLLKDFSSLRFTLTNNLNVVNTARLETCQD
jgi:hypothetical protein